MRTLCTIAMLTTLASAVPDGAGRVRYRESGLDAALAEAKSTGRLVLVMLAMDG